VRVNTVPKYFEVNRLVALCQERLSPWLARAMKVNHISGAGAKADAGVGKDGAVVPVRGDSAPQAGSGSPGASAVYVSRGWWAVQFGGVGHCSNQQQQKKKKKKKKKLLISHAVDGGSRSVTRRHGRRLAPTATWAVTCRSRAGPLSRNRCSGRTAASARGSGSSTGEFWG
jgi:hypothetical protein